MSEIPATPIDPTCMWCGKKWSEHDQTVYSGGCCRCQICFEALVPETCYQDEDGVKWDICVPCAEFEEKMKEEHERSEMGH